MFGYVRARLDMLSEQEREAYQAVYCGICHTMGQSYGQFSRLFLNYDFVFLAMLLAPRNTICSNECKGCILHPIKGKPSCESGEWLEAVAGESVILTYWKLRDSVQDDGFFRSLPSRFLSACLRKAYRIAKTRYPEFDHEVTTDLATLSELEHTGCPSIDKTADCFALILKAAANGWGEDEGQKRVLEQLLYHVGRWIYLIDGIDDLEKDKKQGCFNPIVARFPQWTEDDQDYLYLNLTHSLNMARAAFQLMEPNVWTSVIENILYSGLPAVTELVFCGRWKEYKNRRGTTTDE